MKKILILLMAVGSGRSFAEGTTLPGDGSAASVGVVQQAANLNTTTNPQGQLNGNFGAGGRTYLKNRITDSTGAVSSADVARASGLLNIDGSSLIVSGYSTFGANTLMSFVNFIENNPLTSVGTLVPFPGKLPAGGGGLVTAYQVKSYALGIDSSGIGSNKRIILAGQISFTIGGSTYYYAIVTRLVKNQSSNAWENDITFGDVVSGSTRSGSVIFAFGAVTNHAEGNVITAITFDKNNNIVVAGDYNNGGESFFGVAVIRSTADTAGNGAGSVISKTAMTSHILSTGGLGDWAHAVGVQSSGKIIVGGDSTNGNNYFFTLAQFKSDLTLDTTHFGGGSFFIAGTSGVSQTILNGSSDIANALVINPLNNKIILAGSSQRSPGGNPNFALAQFLENGVLDTTFNAGGAGSPAGTAAVNFGGSITETTINAVALDPASNILVSGYADEAGPLSHFALARFTPAGALDLNFGNSGTQYILTNIAGGTNDKAYGINIDANGGIFVTGTSNNYFAAAKFTGLITTSPSAQATAAEKQAAQAAGAAAVSAKVGSNVLTNQMYIDFVRTFTTSIAYGQNTSTAFDLAIESIKNNVSIFDPLFLVSNVKLADIKTKALAGNSNLADIIINDNDQNIIINNDNINNNGDDDDDVASVRDGILLLAVDFLIKFSGSNRVTTLSNNPLLYACALYVAGYVNSLNQQSPTL